MCKKDLKKELRKIFNNKVLALLLISAIAVWLAVASRPDDRLHLYFCDVGQGDAILIKTPSNKQILVDGGPDDRVLNCLSQALPFYDRSLDLIILTHPHADHVDGLNSVLRTYHVEKVVFYQIPYGSADFQEFVDLLGEKRVEVTEVRAGDNLALDQQVSAHIWYPLSNEDLKVLGASINPSDGENVNDSSIIFRLICGDFAALFTGDAPGDIFPLLSQQGVVGEADVLKVAHHGSRDGLNAQIVNQLKPQLAVISVGKDNRYGHPHAQTLQELKDAGTEVKRTDLDGTIEVVSDCQSWWTR